MVNHYKVNVSQMTLMSGRHQHFFTTEVRDLPHCQMVVAKLREAFPAPEYKIEVTLWEAAGRVVEM